MDELIPLTVLGSLLKVCYSTDTDMSDIAAVIEAARLMGKHDVAEWLSIQENHDSYYNFIRNGAIAQHGPVTLAIEVEEVGEHDIQCDDCGDWLNGLIGEHIHIDAAELTQEQIEATGITESKNVCSECFEDYTPHLNFDDFHHGC